MNHTIHIIGFLLISLSTLAQEKFNTVYYDPDANLSNTVISIPDGYVVLTGTSVDGGRGIGLTKLNNSGEIIIQNKFKFDGVTTFEGEDNCLNYNSINDSFYFCGVVENESFEKYPYFIIFNQNLDTIKTQIIYEDSISGAYDVIMLNDSIFVITTQNIILDDYEMGLFSYNLNTNSLICNFGFGVDNTISNEAGSVIIKTHDNKLLLGGFTFGFSTSTFKQDWYVVKTDSIGNQLWEKYFGNPLENDGRVMAMLEAKDSTYIIAGGQAICNWSMDPISEAAIRKIDTAGNILWEKFYRHYMYRESAEQIWFSKTYCADIIELEDGEFIAICSYERGDGGTLLLLLKLNPQGKILWSKHLHTTDALGSNYCSSIKQTPDNGFIIHGHGSFDFDYDPPQQFFLIKTDSLGCENALYPAPPQENIACLNLPDSLYCSQSYNTKLQIQGKAAPYTIEFSTGETIENLYYPPVFIPNSQGTGSFTVHVGVDTYNHTYDTATLYNPIPDEDMQADIIELPFTISIPEHYFGPDLTATITNGHGESYNITLPVYVDCNVGTEINSDDPGIKLYPNPASNNLYVKLPKISDLAFIKIINATGQDVLVQQLHLKETKLNISQLPKGNYIARIYCGNSIKNVKFVKE